jgi:lathosterol oxidase
MDIVLEWTEANILTGVYDTLIPHKWEWSQDYWLRQYISLFLILTFGGYILYFVLDITSYILLFNKEIRKNKHFLKNQELLEITLSLQSIPIMAIPSAFIFLAEVRGYARLYDNVTEYGGWIYIVFSSIFYLIFTGKPN